MRIDSGEFQASNDARFKEKTVLHRVTDCSATGKEILLSDTVRPYRYWRFYQPKEGSYCNIADIRFYERGSTSPLKAKSSARTVIGRGIRKVRRTKCSTTICLRSSMRRSLPGHGSAWTSAAPRPWNASSTPARGDGNTIDIGDTYELFYWNGQGWSSLGKQEAANICLRFRNVPSGGLYWLRDLSKGKEERIFTYEQGRQVWW